MGKIRKISESHKEITMFWNFAVINNRLAEIFHEGKNAKSIRILGHAFVKKEEYTTKQEWEWIKTETKKLNFSYRKGVYKSKNTDPNR